MKGVVFKIETTRVESKEKDHNSNCENMNLTIKNFKILKE